MTKTVPIRETTFYARSMLGRPIAKPVKMAFADGRIEFLQSPFELKDEIKCMAGARWHQYIEDDGRKIWSVKDCWRNRFAIAYLEGKNPYAWFDKPLEKREFKRPLMSQQVLMASTGLQYHYRIWAAEMRTGKTLSAITVMEESGVKEWWFVGPKKALEGVKREFKKWGLDTSINLKLFTYEGFTKHVDSMKKDDPIPQGIIFDEASRLKTPDALRTQAAQLIADKIREKHGWNGYVILMTGTPAGHNPLDWWALCEICFPGYLKEGSIKAFKKRLAFVETQEYGSGGIHEEMIGWKDDEKKCAHCGQYEEAHDPEENEDLDHEWEPSKNEVAFLHERLKGLVDVIFAKDCLELPDRIYTRVKLPAHPSTLRVAQTLCDSQLNAAVGYGLLRELSDGFQYREVVEGKTTCNICMGEKEVSEWVDPENEERRFESVEMLSSDFTARLVERKITCRQCEGAGEMDRKVRQIYEVPCPKDDALAEQLERNEELGRIVVYAGFTASVDRCVNICLRQGWNVVRCDGRGWSVYEHQSNGTIKTVPIDPLDYWADAKGRVAFVGHPESGGMGISLAPARTIVFFSNSTKGEMRTQAESRCIVPGMDTVRGLEIVDLIHLPTDERLVDLLKENRKLELITMGELGECLTSNAAEAETQT